MRNQSLINKIITFFSILSALLVLQQNGYAQQRKQLNIVQKGRSAYSIILPVTASAVEKTAAKELQEYLQLSTGALLPVIAENKPVTHGIYIGATAYSLSKNISTGREEEWIIKAYNNKIIVTGGSRRGVLYAVYHFLEDIVGVRWWDPWEEDVPRLAALSIPANFSASGNPTFAYRDLYDSIFDDSGIDKKGIGAAYSLYQVRNRLNGHFSYTPTAYGDRIKYGRPYHVHTFSRYFPVTVYYAKHPGWYAWSKEKNKRTDNGQLCLSNQELLRAFKEKVKDSIQYSYDLADRNGEMHPVFFSVSLNDVGGICECDACTAALAQKGPSGYALSFVNKIADYIAPLFPDAKIETLAYWQYRMLPLDATRPAKNVVLRIAEDGKDNMHDISNSNNSEIQERLKQWTKLCDNNNLYIWDYHLNYSNTSNSSPFRFEKDMQLYKQYNAQGIFGEIEWPLVADMWNLRVWMLTRLFENNQLKTDDLISDFTSRYYRAAGKYIREFLYLVKAATDADNTPMTFRTNLFNEKFMSLDLALKGNTLFEAALKSVENDAAAARRVRHARSYFDRFLVNRNRIFETEAGRRGQTTVQLGLDKLLAAQRIVSVLQEQGTFKYFDEKTKKEIAFYEKVSNTRQDLK